MTRRHRRDRWLSVKQLKGESRVDIPESTDLTATLDPFVQKHDGLTLSVDERGKAFSIDGFRHFMREAYDAAGLPKSCTTHGLRYTQATILKELGCDWETTAAITGHETVAMARKYTAQKRKAQLAIARVNRARASERSENENLQNGPAKSAK